MAEETTTVSSYNVPRVLGNIYNTVSYYPGRDIPSAGYTPGAIINSPTLTVSGSYSVNGSSSNNKMILAPWGTGVTLKDVKFNDYITASVNVHTASIPNRGPAGHTFTYTVTAFTIGKGLPYVSGDHVKIVHVGDYVDWTLAPEAKTFPAPRDLTLDVEGDIYSQGSNAYVIGYTNPRTACGVTATKQTIKEGDGALAITKQQLAVKGYAKEPGLYRITLHMTSTAGAFDREAAGTPIYGGEDIESFVLRILPKGPMPGDLCIVQFCEGTVRPVASQKFRITAISGNAELEEVFCDRLKTGAGINSTAFTYVNAVWSPTQPSANTHAKGYWTLSIVSRIPGGRTDRDYNFVLSRDSDKWRMYMFSAYLNMAAWAVIADAPLRTGSGSSIILTPFYLASTGGNLGCNIFAKGDQHCYADGFGVFSTCGNNGLTTIYSQEPCYPNWPSTKYSPTTGSNKILWLADKDNNVWVVADTIDGTTTTATVSLIPDVAVRWCPAKSVHNHGGVYSRDVTLQIPAVVSTVDGDNNPIEPLDWINTSISNYEWVSQLTPYGNQSNDLTWTVKTSGSAVGKAAGYMWTDYYPLPRLVNYLTTNLVVGYSGNYSYNYTHSITEETASRQGGEKFPTELSKYYVPGVDLDVRRYEKSSSTSTDTVNYTLSASWNDTNQAVFHAWTGRFGWFKLAGWNPSAADGTINISDSNSGESKSSRATTQGTLIPGSWILTNVQLSKETSSTAKPAGSGGDCAIVYGGDTKLLDTTYWNEYRSGGRLVGRGGGVSQEAVFTSVGNINWYAANVSATGGGRGTVRYTGPAYDPSYEITDGLSLDDDGGLYTLVGSAGYWGFVDPQNDHGKITAYVQVYSPDAQVVADKLIGPECGDLSVNLSLSASETYDQETISLSVSLQLSVTGPRPEYTIKKESTSKDINTNPFVNWVSYECDGRGVVTMTTGSDFPGTPTTWTTAVPDGDIVTLRAEAPITSGKFKAEITYSFGVPTSGSFIVNSSIKDTDDNRYAVLVWQDSLDTTEIKYTYSGSAAVAMPMPKNDVNASWFAANALVMDGPWGADATSGGLYMVPAGRGGFSLVGDGTYTYAGGTTKTVIKSSWDLCSGTIYSGSNETVYYLSGAQTASGSQVTPFTEERTFGHTTGIGFALAGGVVELPPTPDENVVRDYDIMTSAAGIRNNTDTYYDGTASTEVQASLSSGETDNYSFAGADFHSNVKHNSNDGLGTTVDDETTGAGTKNVNGVVTEITSMDDAKSAVNGVQKPQLPATGWRDNGTPEGATIKYIKDYTENTITTDTTLRVGLQYPK